jgi:hypothetical protein
MIVIPMVLSGILMSAQAAPETEEKLVLPGEPGYVLKRAREVVALARSRDAGARTDLLLGQSRERLKEREALAPGPRSPEGDSVARGLAKAYGNLTLAGAPGTIECGVAEGRDMREVQNRYLEATRREHERWEKILASASPEERGESDAVLRVASLASGRAAEAQAAGLEFLKKERARREGLVPPPIPPPAPRPPSNPDPPRPEREANKTEADPVRKTPEGNSHASEHHPPHPHRPHR